MAIGTSRNKWGESYPELYERVRMAGFHVEWKQYKALVRGQLQAADPDLGDQEVGKRAWKLASIEFPPNMPPTDKVYKSIDALTVTPTADKPVRNLGDRPSAGDDPDVTFENFRLSSDIWVNVPPGGTEYTDEEIRWGDATAMKIRLHQRGVHGIDWGEAPSLNAISLTQMAYKDSLQYHKLFGKQLLPSLEDDERGVRKDIEEHDIVCAKLEAEFVKHQNEWRLDAPIELPA